MEKKYFEAPYLKVVRVQNDIIATSVTINDQEGNGDHLAPGREDWEEEY